ncbi:MAG: phosphoribosyltransferase family protein [Firmicutes bacterium]|nr:phosphoribosyltransferase family protein [Bacillota bacterium]
MDYKVKLNGTEYGLPIVQIKDGLSIAVFDMLSSVKMSQDASKALYEKLKASDIELSKIDTVISAETKGIILAYQISEYLDCDMVIMRKEQKIYHPNVTRGAVDTYTTRNRHYLYLDNNQIPKLRGKNVLIVDDVVSTGSSLLAIESILSEVGANICGKAFVFAEGEAADRDDIIFVNSLPLI